MIVRSVKRELKINSVCQKKFKLFAASYLDINKFFSVFVKRLDFSRQKCSLLSSRFAASTNFWQPNNLFLNKNVLIFRNSYLRNQRRAKSKPSKHPRDGPGEQA